MPETATITSRLRRCFEERRFDDLADLYAVDAVVEIHAGPAKDVHTGHAQLIRRYAEDFGSPTTFLRWDERRADWGAVVEAEAVQGEAPRRTRYRWVHLLTVDDGQFTRDTIYCTGAIPASDAGNEL